MIEEFSKAEWRKFVNKKIDNKNAKDLLKMMKPQKKINLVEISQETYGMKDYIKELTYDQALTKFRLRAKVLPTVKTHFKCDKNFTRDLWSCSECSLLDTSNHLLNLCPKYEDLRKGKNFDNEEEVVIFFHEVIERREQEECLLINDDDQ